MIHYLWICFQVKQFTKIFADFKSKRHGLYHVNVLYQCSILSKSKYFIFQLILNEGSLLVTDTRTGDKIVTNYDRGMLNSRTIDAS